MNGRPGRAGARAGRVLGPAIRPAPTSGSASTVDRPPHDETVPGGTPCCGGARARTSRGAGGSRDRMARGHGQGRAARTGGHASGPSRVLGAATATNEYVEGDLDTKQAQNAAKTVRLDLLKDMRAGK
ncbi:hypothetical protein [Streptomyces pratensis]|uniref:hypothetical protein n=1 Tax=Streptomyces pratensis TaxID=1169025 RepID=UPI003AFAF2BE